MISANELAKAKLIVKQNRLGIGIDIGWRTEHIDGHVDWMWGNTKNDQTLVLLLKDIENKYGKREIIDERRAESNRH